MDRADLHSAFTKINLWRQTQFSKIVYVDADVVAYRAPDELFDLPQAFAAAPDIGWPDLFNTGVMVLTPDLGEFYAMLAMAERGISFDGADQGLLNMHFGRGFHRLPFTYNVTPSAHYQYIPAYRHFRSSINMVHFIGSNKPWLAGRDAPHGNSPFDEMVGRWWAVYDRHYRIQVCQRPGAPCMRRSRAAKLTSPTRKRLRGRHSILRPALCSTSQRESSGPRLSLLHLGPALSRATTVLVLWPRSLSCSILPLSILTTLLLLPVLRIWPLPATLQVMIRRGLSLRLDQSSMPANHGPQRAKMSPKWSPKMSHPQ